MDLASLLEAAAVCLKRLYSELSVDNQIVFAAALGNKLCGSNAATQAARWCGAIHREFELQKRQHFVL